MNLSWSSKMADSTWLWPTNVFTAFAHYKWFLRHRLMTSLENCNANHIFCPLLFHTSFSSTTGSKNHTKINAHSDNDMCFFIPRYLYWFGGKKVLFMQIFHTCLVSKRVLFGQVVKNIKQQLARPDKPTWKINLPMALKILKIIAFSRQIQDIQ